MNAWIAAMALIIAFTLGFGRPAHGQVPCHYEVAHIIQAPPCPITGPPPTSGQDISPNGRYVVGYYDHCSISGRYKGFLFDTQTGQFRTLPFPTTPSGVTSVQCYGVNDTPWIVGHMGGIGGDFGFVFDVATWQYIATIAPAVNTGTSSLYAINNQRVACGMRGVLDTPQEVKSNAILWSLRGSVVDLGLINGQTTSATDINESGQVCGWTGIPQSPAGFRYSNGSITVFGPVPDGTYCGVSAINNAGLISAGGSTMIPYLWDDTFQSFPVLNAEFNKCGFNDVNDVAVEVGTCRNSASPSVKKPVIWVNGVPSDLAAMTTPVLNLTLEWSISIANGWVIGLGAHFSGREVFAVLRPTASIIGDTDCNSAVNIDDLLNVINGWGTCGACLADVNGDHLVNIDDLLTVITHWTN